MSIRILLADDQRLFVENLKTVLEQQNPDLEVVAIAENGEEAVRLALEHRPDLVLMDIRMPVMDGVEATRLIHESAPDMAILVLTTFDDDEYVHDALAHGAAGYLLKNIPSAVLIMSIRNVLAGTVQLSPDVVSHLVEKASFSAEERSFPIEKLSSREREVLFLMSRGYENSSIAEKLYLSEQTVKNHISHIYHKLEIHERIGVMKAARDSRLKDFCQHLLNH